MIYSGEDIINVDSRATSRPNTALGQAVDGELIKLASYGAGKGQIGSRMLRAFFLR
jgi:hypothetical protein